MTLIHCYATLGYNIHAHIIDNQHMNELKHTYFKAHTKDLDSFMFQTEKKRNILQWYKPCTAY